jgi:hypothetical protein
MAIIVNEVRSDRVLPSKLESTQPAGAKAIPEVPLWQGAVLAELTTAESLLVGQDGMELAHTALLQDVRPPAENKPSP